MTGTERKVFQKYYPPDFDPAKIPRAKGQRNRQFVQRVMAPFNMQCNTCHEYIYKGKKFNMRRETAEGEFYLGLKIFRFYFRCPNCLAEITFKTDLENCDYVQEHGATRLFEAFKLYQQEEKAKETQEEEDKKDPMKMLEKRTKMSRAEMEAIGKLEEIQEINRRHEAFDPDQYLADQRMSEAQAIRMQEERDEEFIRSLYGRTADGKIIKRIVEDDDEDEDKIALGGVQPKIKVKAEVEARANAAIKLEPRDELEPGDMEHFISQAIASAAGPATLKEEMDGDEPCCSSSLPEKSASAEKAPEKSAENGPKKPAESLAAKRPVQSTQKQILSKAVIVKRRKKPDDSAEEGKQDVGKSSSKEPSTGSGSDGTKGIGKGTEETGGGTQTNGSGSGLPGALLGLADYGSDSSSD